MINIRYWCNVFMTTLWGPHIVIRRKSFVGRIKIFHGFADPCYTGIRLSKLKKKPGNSQLQWPIAEPTCLRRVNPKLVTSRQLVDNHQLRLLILPKNVYTFEGVMVITIKVHRKLKLSESCHFIVEGKKKNYAVRLAFCENEHCRKCALKFACT